MHVHESNGSRYHPAQAGCSWRPTLVQAQAPEKRAILGSHEFFRGLPSSIIQRLASHARQSHCAAGRRIFSKGDEGHGLLAILSGVVKISVPSEDGKEI